MLIKKNYMFTRDFKKSMIYFILFAALLILGCFEDNMDNSMALENKMLDAASSALIPDYKVTDPIPGNNGIITTSDITVSSIRLHWTKAIDDITIPSDLQYKVYRSKLNNIRTPQSAENNGDVVIDWTNDIESVNSIGLTASTVYYFNVVVMDSNNNRVAYTTVSATTDGVVYIFSDEKDHTGNLVTKYTSSARADVDNICSSFAVYATLPCSHVKAFISLSETDSIANMPENFAIPVGNEIVGKSVKTGEITTIAYNWKDLLDGDIITTLDSAIELNNQWWSGSNQDGTYNGASSNCDAWTATGNDKDEYKGIVGVSNKSDAEWINSGETFCKDELHVLCICW